MYSVMEVAQGHAVRGTCKSPGVGRSDRKGFLKELITDRVVLTTSGEVIPLDSSDHSDQHKQSQETGDW